MSAEPGRRGLPGLLAGLVLLDLLLNLPRFDASFPMASLVVPSIDLLVMLAACIGIAQAGEGARIPLRVAVSVLAVLLVAWKAGSRFGVDIPLRLFGSAPLATVAGWAVAAASLAGAGVATFLLSGLLVRGLQAGLVRSIVLLVIALAAVIHVLFTRAVFTPSVVPRIIRDIGSLL